MKEETTQPGHQFAENRRQYRWEKLDELYDKQVTVIQFVCLECNMDMVMKVDGWLPEVKKRRIDCERKNKKETRERGEV